MTVFYVYPGTDGIKVASTSATEVTPITIGTAADTLGFYGLATPIAKATVTRKTTTTTTVASLKARVAKLENAIANLGLVALTG